MNVGAAQHVVQRGVDNYLWAEQIRKVYIYAVVMRGGALGKMAPCGIALAQAKDAFTDAVFGRQTQVVARGKVRRA